MVSNVAALDRLDAYGGHITSVDAAALGVALVKLDGTDALTRVLQQPAWPDDGVARTRLGDTGRGEQLPHLVLSICVHDATGRDVEKMYTALDGFDTPPDDDDEALHLLLDAAWRTRRDRRGPARARGRKGRLSSAVQTRTGPLSAGHGLELAMAYDCLGVARLLGTILARGGRRVDDGWPCRRMSAFEVGQSW